MLDRGGRVNVVKGVENVRLGNRRLYKMNGGRAFVTAEHPFMTTEGWKSINPLMTRAENETLSVSRLEEGDEVVILTSAQVELFADGRTAAYTSGGEATMRLGAIESTDAPANTPVFNLLLDGDHTYFADDFLVHNKGGDGGGGGGDSGESGSSDDSGESGESGSSDDSGESGESGSSDDSGESGDSSKSGSSDDSGESGESGDSSKSGSSGESGGASNSGSGKSADSGGQGRGQGRGRGRGQGRGQGSGQGGGRGRGLQGSTLADGTGGNDLTSAGPDLTRGEEALVIGNGWSTSQ